ncbi:MAG TPA: hypothetical protein VKZ53_05510 [Candidatus Angelobacter sp.]|nr:hypothetical protein [Candidatus Angelobacter sp.]
MLLSSREAKQFLVDKVVAEASVRGVTLSEDEKRLLLFSEEDPGSEKGLSSEALYDDNPGYETKIVGLLRSAYRREKRNPVERQKYKDALLKLKEGDHYILVMAEPALAEGKSVRDLLIYVAIGFAIIVLCVFIFR